MIEPAPGSCLWGFMFPFFLLYCISSNTLPNSPPSSPSLPCSQATQPGQSPRSPIMAAGMPVPNIDSLFDGAEGDGDGSIDEKEWTLFTARRKAMHAKYAAERSKLLATQRSLKERMKSASEECREGERKEREYFEKRRGMLDMIANLDGQNEALREQINGGGGEGGGGRGGGGGGGGGDREGDEEEFHVKKFAHTVLNGGLDKFARFLNSAILGDSAASNEYVTPRALRLALVNLGVDHEGFDLRDLCRFFGEGAGGVVTKRRIVDEIRLHGVAAE